MKQATGRENAKGDKSAGIESGLGDWKSCASFADTTAGED